jgi:hypothetical protein
LCSENPKERDHLEDLSVDGRIVMKWILKECDGTVWTGFIWLRIENTETLFNAIMNLLVP